MHLGDYDSDGYEPGNFSDQKRFRESWGCLTWRKSV